MLLIFSIALHATETHFKANVFFPKQATQNVQTLKNTKDLQKS